MAQVKGLDKLCSSHIKNEARGIGRISLVIRLLLAFSHPALPLLSVPIVAIWGVMDCYIFDNYRIENLQ
jgi:hypothetical protein